MNTFALKTEYQSIEEWREQAAKLFGTDSTQWKFVCPSCGHITMTQDWIDAGDTDKSMVAFSCIGRLLSSKNSIGSNSSPCNYAGGGLFQLNPVTVNHDGNKSKVFQFYYENKEATPNGD